MRHLRFVLLGLLALAAAALLVIPVGPPTESARQLARFLARPPIRGASQTPLRPERAHIADDGTPRRWDDS